MDAIKLQRLLDFQNSRIEALETRCENLEAILNENFENLIITEINKLWVGNEELHLRVLFALQYFQFGRQVDTGIIGNDGQPVMRMEKLTLFDLYVQQREQFAAKVKADEEELARLNADAAGAGAEEIQPPAGISADAPPAEPEKSTSIILPGDFRRAH